MLPGGRGAVLLSRPLAHRLSVLFCILRFFFTRPGPVLPAKASWAFITPESSTAMPMPLPS